MIGAGSVVENGIFDNVTAYGCPEKVRTIKQNNEMNSNLLSTHSGGGKIANNQAIMLYKGRTGHAA